MNMIEIDVDGLRVVLDVEADLTLGDLSEDMDSVSSLIAWYGRVLAAARRNLDDAGDLAKHNAGRIMESRFAADPKCGVEKARVAVDADPSYLKARRAVSAAREVVGRLDSAYTALQVKADILRSKGALARAELDTTGMHTSTTEAPPRGGSRASKPAGAPMSDEDRRRAVAQAMRERRRPTAATEPSEEEGEALDPDVPW